MTRTFYAVVDERGQFKRKGRFDTGEFSTFHEASNFLLSLTNVELYSVQEFTEDEDEQEWDDANVGEDRRAEQDGCGGD